MLAMRLEELTADGIYSNEITTIADQGPEAGESQAAA
jgi:hypothetical protein